jgi:hypothetical protein
MKRSIMACCPAPTRPHASALRRLGRPLIDGLLRKWLARLPHPFTPEDRAAGYRYDVSILQAEFALTQVLNRPQTGRALFEEVIRENLDLGRPDHVQLIFDRRVTKRTPGRFRTRVITRASRPRSTWTTRRRASSSITRRDGRCAPRPPSTTRDFAIGKRLHNLPALRAVGFAANRRLLDVQQLSHDCLLGDDAFQQVTRPQVVAGQRCPLPFADPRTQALLSVLVLYCLLPQGFVNKDVREHLAPLLGRDPSTMTPGKMTYDLRRLRLHGLIERLPHSQRYRVTRRVAHRVILHPRLRAHPASRPGAHHPGRPARRRGVASLFRQAGGAIDRWIDQAKLAA